MGKSFKALVHQGHIAKVFLMHKINKASRFTLMIPALYIGKNEGNIQMITAD